MADLDVVTLTEAKTRLGGSVTNVGDDAAIQADITALSALFDTRYGAVVQRAISGEQIGHDRWCDAWLEYWPIVGTVTVDAGTATVEDARFGVIRLTDTAAGTVDYTAGRFADTASVSEQFKAAFIVALRNWRQADHAAPFVPAGPDYPTPRTSFPTFAVPRACDQMLAKYRRPVGIA